MNKIFEMPSQVERHTRTCTFLYSYSARPQSSAVLESKVKVLTVFRLRHISSHCIRSPVQR